MAIPVSLTSRILNKIFSNRPNRLGWKLSYAIHHGGRSYMGRRIAKLDTSEKIWAEAERYLKKGALLSSSCENMTPLEAACSRGDIAIARKLVDLGADVNLGGNWHPDNTPLTRAAAAANPELVRFLLEKGADPNFVSDYDKGAIDSLVWAATTHKYQGATPGKPAEAQECLKILLEYGFVPTPEQKKNVFEAGQMLAPLLPEVQAALDMKAAMEANDLPAMRELLVSGAHADLLASYWVETPLCHAAKTGNLPMIELLVGAGANLELPSPATRYTPLQAATFNGQKEAFVALLHKGADAKAPCAVRYDDPTTLHDVAKHSVNPRMTEFVQNVMDTIASAPPPVNTDASIKVNKPIRIKQAMTP